MDDVADDEAVAGFAARYAGALEVRDAIRWAQDPFAPAADGGPSPAALLDARRRQLYRGTADAADVERFRADTAAWEHELALARAALAGPPADPPPSSTTTSPTTSTTTAAPRHPLVRVVLLAGVSAALVLAVLLLRPPVPPPAPPVAAGVPGVLVARASAHAGPRSATRLDGAGHYLTVVVTCQGDGSVDVRLSDGTDARFACIAAFPRTAVQPSDSPVHRFGYTIRVTGSPDWAMTLSR